MKRYLNLGLGWFLVGVGVIGLFVPILQGFLFIAIGSALLSKESERVRTVVESFKKRWAGGRKVAQPKPEQ